jgi:hypothetical protein
MAKNKKLSVRKAKKLPPRKVGRPQKVVSIDTVRDFVLANGSEMSNEKMAKRLKIKPIRIAGCIAALKRLGVISNDFLLTDIAKSQKPKRTRKRVKKASFGNYFGEKKEIARNMMAESIKESGLVEGKILSLPAAKCILEKKIVNEVSKHFKFDVAEIEPSTKVKMMRTILKDGLPVATISENISDMIAESKADKYSHLLLDYCASFESINKDLTTAMKHKIVKRGGTISFTFSQRYGRSKEGEVNIIDRLNGERKYKREESKTLSAMSSFMSKFGNFKRINYLSYKDGLENPPMLLMVVKRIK